MKIAIIVPFRDVIDGVRTQQLCEFIRYMNVYLVGHNYRIFVIEQTDDGRKFNRGQLLNIGFNYAKLWGADNFIFHDVDLLPSDELKKYYIRKPTNPVHIASVWSRYGNNPHYFGGVVAFNYRDFMKINGYPNNFWGWGGEDDELYKRTTKFFNITKATKGTMIDLENMNIEQKKDFLKENKLIFMLKYEALAQHNKTWKLNGLNSLFFEEKNYNKCGIKCVRILVDLTD